MDKKYTALIAGAIFGILSFFSPGSFFILILAAASIFFICRIPDRSERDFILFIFLAGLIIRIALVLVAMSWAVFKGHILDYVTSGCPAYNTPYILDDSGYYTLRSWFTNMHWSGISMSEFTVKGFVKNTYGFSGFIYILAVFFKMFGYSPMASRFINCFLGALTGVLVYFTLKSIFNERPAKLAAILTSFFPSLVLWSTTNLKETAMIFTTCLLLFFLVKFQEKRRIYYLALALISIIFQAFIRYSFGLEFIFITCAIAGVYVFCLYVANLQSTKRAILIILIFIIGGLVIFLEKEKVNLVIDNVSQYILLQQRGVTNAGGICYKLLPEDYYADKKDLEFVDAARMFRNGWFHIMFEPLPWREQSSKMIASFPQTVLWYFFIPFAILGVVILARYRLKESAFLIAYFFVITSILAMVGGNIGTIFRLRDINTPIFLMFSSVGLVNTFSSLSKTSKTEARRK